LNGRGLSLVNVNVDFFKIWLKMPPMKGRRNIIAAGVRGMVLVTPPVFSASLPAKTPSDYFLAAGEYLGKGFAEATHEAENQSRESLANSRGDHKARKS